MDNFTISIMIMIQENVKKIKFKNNGIFFTIFDRLKE
jgi:hypothetical protein